LNGGFDTKMRTSPFAATSRRHADVLTEHSVMHWRKNLCRQASK
jgi:hypothetical protein